MGPRLRGGDGVERGGVEIACHQPCGAMGPRDEPEDDSCGGGERVRTKNKGRITFAMRPCLSVLVGPHSAGGCGARSGGLAGG